MELNQKAALNLLSGALPSYEGEGKLVIQSVTGVKGRGLSDDEMNHYMSQYLAEKGTTLDEVRVTVAADTKIHVGSIGGDLEVCTVEMLLDRKKLEAAAGKLYETAQRQKPAAERSASTVNVGVR